MINLEMSLEPPDNGSDFAEDIDTNHDGVCPICLHDTEGTVDHDECGEEYKSDQYREPEEA